MSGVTGAAAGILERPTHRQKLPIIRIVAQRKLQHSPGTAVSGFSGWQRRPETAQPRATCPNHKFTNAVFLVLQPFRILWRKTFVIVIVAVQHQVGVSSVEIVPERRQLGGIAMLGAGTKKRDMPKRQNTLAGIMLEILAQPPFFRRTLLTAANLRALTVESDDVPVTEFKAVVKMAGRSRGSPEVAQISAASLCAVLVIARRRTRARFVASPASGVTIGESLVGSTGIGKIAQRENCSRLFVQQFCGAF